MNIHALILAAGESKRLGQPKQLIQFEGKTLLAHVMSHLEPLVTMTHVVLGAHEETIKQNVVIKHPLSNPNWQQGMASSLAFGISNLPDCDAVLVALSDQILIPVEHYQNLISASNSFPEHIIATQHKSLGVPAIFPAQYFTQLSTLTGDLGAKAIITNQLSQVKTIACQQAAFDIDCPADLSVLN
ncbi:nucleotidyltransferase family protein [Marinicella rhabdoformis]|uniref:nucleotidyltransferase family protein n=1 Tax=Marinicella rhabdoformis TaxID=2580566 RepID=UPI0012AED948|nr:nucleotidyltransferase family protein [Marinicella rhabdoformis]